MGKSVLGEHIFRVKVGDRVYIAAYPNADYNPVSATSSARGTVKVVVEDKFFYEPIVLKFPAGALLWKFRELLELAFYEDVSLKQIRGKLGPVLRKAAKSGRLPKLLPDSQHQNFGSGAIDPSIMQRQREHILHNRNPWDRSFGIGKGRKRR